MSQMVSEMLFIPENTGGDLKKPKKLSYIAWQTGDRGIHSGF